MLSIPPATMMPLWPSWMFWVASIIAFMPLAQTLLMVVASVVSGILQCISLLVDSLFFKVKNAPGADTDLPGGRLPNTSLDDVTHIKLLDLLWLDTGLFDGVLDGDDTELRGGDGGEGAVLCADGGTGGGDDVHGVDLWDVDVSWRMHKRQAQRTIMRACLIFCDKRRREVRIVYTAENRGVQGGVLVREGRIQGFRKRESSGVIVCMRRIWDVHL